MFSDRDYSRRSSCTRGYAHETSVIMPLIVANIIVFVLQQLTSGSNQGLTAFLTLDWGSLKQFQVWRLGTYMFAHANFMHILVNMWGIWIFGRPLEYRIGSHRFLNLYLISGLTGGIIWLVFNSSPFAVFHGQSIYPSVLGASGALFGVMVGAAMVAPNLRYMLLIPPIPIRLKTLVAVYAIIEIIALPGGEKRGGVAHLAHLGGLVGGYIYMRFNAPGGGTGIIDGGLFNAWQKLRAWWRRRSFKFSSTTGANSSNQRDNDLAKSIDDILDKIGREGINSLTATERRKLEEARDRLKNNRGR